jgi:hypothetical protein
MAWTTPKTWVLEELVTATDLNTFLRDNMLFLKTSLDSSGKIVAINSTYFASLSGTNLTGVAKLAATNSFTAGKHDFNGGSGTRLVVPVGTNKWAV